MDMESRFLQPSQKVLLGPTCNHQEDAYSLHLPWQKRGRICPSYPYEAVQSCPTLETLVPRNCLRYTSTSHYPTNFATSHRPFERLDASWHQVRRSAEHVHGGLPPKRQRQKLAAIRWWQRIRFANIHSPQNQWLQLTCDLSWKVTHDAISLCTKYWANARSVINSKPALSTIISTLPPPFSLSLVQWSARASRSSWSRFSLLFSKILVKISTFVFAASAGLRGSKTDSKFGHCLSLKSANLNRLPNRKIHFIAPERNWCCKINSLICFWKVRNSSKHRF